MDKIERYIDSIYKNLKGNKNEIEDLKQDMRSHLLQTVEELKLEGKTEDESINVAISRFGDLKQVQIDLAGLFKIQRKFASNIIIISLLALLLSILCFFSYKAIYKNSNFSLVVPESLRSSVEDKLIKNEEISNTEVNNLLAKYKKQFKYVSISNRNTDSTYIISPENILSEEVEKDNSALITYINSLDGSTWTIKYGFDISGFNFSLPSLLFSCTIIFFVIYWILFGIWCVVKAYHDNRLNLSWILLFFTLNFIGYIIFKLDKVNTLRLRYSYN